MKKSFILALTMVVGLGVSSVASAASGIYDGDGFTTFWYEYGAVTILSIHYDDGTHELWRCDGDGCAPG